MLYISHQIPQTLSAQFAYNLYVICISIDNQLNHCFPFVYHSIVPVLRAQFIYRNVYYIISSVSILIIVPVLCLFPFLNEKIPAKKDDFTLESITLKWTFV